MKLELTPDGNFECPDDPGDISYPNRPKRRSVTPEEAEILSRLAQGKRVLEIGTGLGVSTRALAETASYVVTIDIDPWVQDPGISNVYFLRYRPFMVHCYEFDMAFIDGSHKLDCVIGDLEYCRPVPILVLHDTYLPEVRQAIAHVGLSELEAFDTRCRLAVYEHNSGDPGRPGASAIRA